MANIKATSDLDWSNIVPRTDHNTALTIDHTIIHKTDQTTDNINTTLKSMR